MSINKSRAERLIAQGCLTNSKHWDRYSNVIPSHISHGYECYLYTDTDRYTDLVAGLGANHFGYGNRTIINEMIRYAYSGACHSLPTIHELDTAERVKELYPFIDRVKFVNDGSSACSASIAIARRYTGRTKVYTEGYHGWHDEMVRPVQVFQNDNDYFIRPLKNIDDISTEIAAVIIEPVQLDNSKERINWLKRLRTKCTETGTILIWDEIITGIRYNKFGVCNNYGIHPDMLLLSKAIANGEKIAVVGGHRDLMDCDYFVSGTFHGHVQALIAANETMRMAKHDRKYDLENLNSESLRFRDKLNEMASGIFWLEGWGCRMAFKGDPYLYWQEMGKCKVILGPSLFFNFFSVKLIDELLEMSETIIRQIKLGNCRLKGPKPTPAFSSKSRE